MEEIINQQISKLLIQRESMVEAIGKLNENTMQYSMKNADLNMQVDKIDIQIHNSINTLNSFETYKINNTA